MHPKLPSSGRLWAASRPATAGNTAKRITTGFIRLRSTLSTIWMPTGGKSPSHDEDGHGKLVRGGFLHQSQSGIFQFLPLGHRVQTKLENLVDKHMQSIGASRLSLSTITSEDLWRKSGRLESVSSELFRLKDRKDTPMMLSPTHEEEITTLVAGTLKSHKDLPLKLYQITRKYRDEKRPRHGLLRSREFLMKDLYTFDNSVETALETYQSVSKAYAAIFADLKLPILVAEASSGDMGGDHSHEYHLPHSVGEDTVVKCQSCGYTANDEVAATRPSNSGKAAASASADQVKVWRGVTQDHKTLVNVWYPDAGLGDADVGPNLHAVRKVVPDLDVSISDPSKLWDKILASAGAEVPVITVVDSNFASSFEGLRDSVTVLPAGHGGKIAERTILENDEGHTLNLSQVADGDGCPRCADGTLRVEKALELGHTFHLGTRYSAPLKAQVTLPSSPRKPVPVQMGCYGIGISRIIGAVAEHLADKQGLNWPRAISPFEAIVIPTSGVDDDVTEFYDKLVGSVRGGDHIDAALDDRKESFGWKMRDADLIGYPVSVILGKGWKEQGTCEVQCRRLSVKKHVSLDRVSGFVHELLERL